MSETPEVAALRRYLQALLDAAVERDRLNADLARERRRAVALRTALVTVLAAGNAAYNVDRVDGGRPTDPYIERIVDTAADALADAVPGEEGQGK
jgi:hypothetical protein